MKNTNWEEVITIFGVAVTLVAAAYGLAAI